MAFYDARTLSQVQVGTDANGNLKHVFGEARWHSREVQTYKEPKKEWKLAAVMSDRWPRSNTLDTVPLYVLLNTLVKDNELRNPGLAEYVRSIRTRMFILARVMERHARVPADMKDANRVNLEWAKAGLVGKQSDSPSEEWELDATRDSNHCRYVLTRPLARVLQLAAWIANNTLSIRWQDEYERQAIVHFTRDERFRAETDPATDNVSLATRLVGRRIAIVTDDKDRSAKPVVRVVNGIRARILKTDPVGPMGERDPVHTSGVYQDYFVCCGRPLNSPGCLIDVYNPTIGKSLPYSLGGDFYPYQIIERAINGNTDARLAVEQAWKQSRVRGTAYIDLDHYNRLDQGIVALVDQLASPLASAYLVVYARPRSSSAWFTAMGEANLNRLVQLHLYLFAYNAYRKDESVPAAIPRTPLEWVRYFENNVIKGIVAYMAGLTRLASADPYPGSVKGQAGVGVLGSTRIPILHNDGIPSMTDVFTSDVMMEIDRIPLWARSVAPAAPAPAAGGGGGGGLPAFPVPVIDPATATRANVIDWFTQLVTTTRNPDTTTYLPPVNGFTDLVQEAFDAYKEAMQWQDQIASINAVQNSVFYFAELPRAAVGIDQAQIDAFFADALPSAKLKQAVLAFLEILTTRPMDPKIVDLYNLSNYKLDMENASVTISDMAIEAVRGGLLTIQTDRDAIQLQLTAARKFKDEVDAMSLPATVVVASTDPDLIDIFPRLDSTIPFVDYVIAADVIINMSMKSSIAAPQVLANLGQLSTTDTFDQYLLDAARTIVQGRAAGGAPASPTLPTIPPLPTGGGGNDNNAGAAKTVIVKTEPGAVPTLIPANGQTTLQPAKLLPLNDDEARPVMQKGQIQPRIRTRLEACHANLKTIARNESSKYVNAVTSVFDFDTFNAECVHLIATVLVGNKTIADANVQVPALAGPIEVTREAFPGMTAAQYMLFIRGGYPTKFRRDPSPATQCRLIQGEGEDWESPRPFYLVTTWGRDPGVKIESGKEPEAYSVLRFPPSLETSAALGSDNMILIQAAAGFWANALKIFLDITRDEVASIAFDAKTLYLADANIKARNAMSNIDNALSRGEGKGYRKRLPFPTKRAPTVTTINLVDAAVNRTLQQEDEEGQEKSNSWFDWN